MSKETVVLNGHRYSIAKDRNGNFMYSSDPRPSQPGDPGGIGYLEWEPFGPDLDGFEGPSGRLGRSYGINTDGRWYGMDLLGPQINTVTLDTYDVTHADSIPSTLTSVPSSATPTVDGFWPGPGSAADLAFNIEKFGPYLYVPRGIQLAKVQISDMTLKRSGVMFKGSATSALTVVFQDGGARSNELAVGLGDSYPYLVNTLAADHPNTDVWAENSEGQAVRIFGQGADRTVGLNGQSALGNILSSVVTMKDPSWQEVAQIQGQHVQMTGFALDGSLWVLGTDNGPYMLDSATGEFFPIFPELDGNDIQCRGMNTWSPMGVIVPLTSGIRFQKFGASEPFGPEMWQNNTSPVQGRPNGRGAGTTRWYYQPIYNPVTTDTYLVAWRKREAGDPNPFPMQPFTIAKFTAKQCLDLKYIGTANGLRTNETLVGGYGSDLFYTVIGRTNREPDDSNYRHALAGTTYLTESRRSPNVIKDLEAYEVETADCDANKTITPSVLVNGSTTVNLSAIVSNGYHSLPFSSGGVPIGSNVAARRIQPYHVFASNVATSSPKVVGNIRIRYRWRPQKVTAYEFTILLEDEDADAPAETLARQLMDDFGSGPVAFEDLYLDSVYVRVDSIHVEVLANDGGGEDTDHKFSHRVRIHATSWQTAEV